MKDDLLVSEPFGRKGFPIDLADGSWPRCPDSGRGRCEAGGSQCVWTTTRNETSPRSLISFTVLPACRIAGIKHGCLAICRERLYCIVSRTQVNNFLDCGSLGCLSDLLDIPCHCNNKCGILTNCVLNPSHFAALDKGHWGMHLLRDSLPALGLHLIGGFHICEKQWQPVHFQLTFEKLGPKAFAKILHRVAMFSSPSHSIVMRSCLPPPPRASSGSEPNCATFALRLCG